MLNATQPKAYALHHRRDGRWVPIGVGRRTDPQPLLKLLRKEEMVRGEKLKCLPVHAAALETGGDGEGK
jgi:hypothetical protein